MQYKVRNLPTVLLILMEKSLSLVRDLLNYTQKAIKIFWLVMALALKMRVMLLILFTISVMLSQLV